MDYNKKIRDLVITLYPSPSLYVACIKCSQELGYSKETLYKICRNYNYKGRKSLFLLLTLIKEKKIWTKKETILKNYLKKIQQTKS